MDFRTKRFPGVGRAHYNYLWTIPTREIMHFHRVPKLNFGFNIGCVFHIYVRHFLSKSRFFILKRGCFFHISIATLGVPCNRTVRSMHSIDSVGRHHESRIIVWRENIFLLWQIWPYQTKYSRTLNWYRQFDPGGGGGGEGFTGKTWLLMHPCPKDSIRKVESCMAHIQLSSTYFSCLKRGCFLWFSIALYTGTT